MKYLIAGLGNIGPEYHETRHNIGFMVVDALAQAAGITFNDGRYGFTATMSVKGRQLILLKPSTFMNLSGNAVRYWMQKENIPLENVLIVVDDLALPFGTLRLKGKGSDAGHNGDISPRTLQTLRDTGRLAFTQIQRKIYYRPEDVEKLMVYAAMKRKEKAVREKRKNDSINWKRHGRDY